MIWSHLKRNQVPNGISNMLQSFQKTNFSIKLIMIIILVITLIFRRQSYQCSSTVLHRGPLGATRIHSYTRIASSIRTWFSDLYMTRCRHFCGENLWVRLYSRMKTFLLVPRQASNHRHTTSWGVNID